jgi:hypothetical protein
MLHINYILDDAVLGCYCLICLGYNDFALIFFAVIMNYCALISYSERYTRWIW